MYDVLDVCRYIISYSQDNRYSISNLKLQKLLYLIQAYFLICINKPCFKDKIEAWSFGPVVPKAYREYKSFGSSSIPKQRWYIKPSGETSLFDDYDIKKADKERINAVIDQFKNNSATDLVKITHAQDPWKNAYKEGKNKEITTEAIRRYFVDE